MSDEEMEQLFDRVERELGGAYREAAEWLRDTNQLDDVEARVASNDLAGAIVGIEDAANRVAAAVASGYVTAGESAAVWLDKLVPGNLITFDTTAWRAVVWASQNKLDLVREISVQQRQIIGEVLQRHAGSASNPRVIARDLRQSIGLTSYQEGIVNNYRSDLQTGDLSSALGRQLSDGRYDRSLRAAMRDGKAIPEAQIDRMVEAYRKNWVGYRAEVIARTEGLRVVHQGTEELFAQAIERGQVAKNRLVQQWNSAHDGRTRLSHRTMDGQKRAIGDSFLTGDGYAIRYPGDPAAPIEETAQCRCNRSMRLLSAAAAAQMLAAA